MQPKLKRCSSSDKMTSGFARQRGARSSVFASSWVKLSASVRCNIALMRAGLALSRNGDVMFQESENFLNDKTVPLLVSMEINVIAFLSIFETGCLVLFVLSVFVVKRNTAKPMTIATNSSVFLVR